MRRALVIGIDNYKIKPLFNCVNDALEIEQLLRTNEDESTNFVIRHVLNENATKENIRQGLEELFLGEDVDVALFYFSGHGVDNSDDGIVVSFDYSMDDLGIPMLEILEYAHKSKCKNKVIILDCCKSGLMGQSGVVGDHSVLSKGMTILTATSEKGLASDGNSISKHGLFTMLFLEGLRGGASDILGRVTPGSVYSYIDQALGAWDQRPVFKTNISEFIVLRECNPKIDKAVIRKLTRYFPTPDFELFLDPSYEETNLEGGYHLEVKPYATPENVEKLHELQKFNRNGLLVPKSVKHMYDVVMRSEACVLTPLGKHYWNLVKKQKID